MGNDDPQASVPGEIVPVKEFYDYDAKYLDEGSQLIIPAKLTKARDEEGTGVGGARVPGCGLLRPGRVDFLMDPKTRQDLRERDQHHARIHLDQHVSQAVGGIGISYSDLIDRLIQLGIERHEDKKKNQYSR